MAVADAGFASIGMPQRAGGLFPQPPARKIEGIDVRRDTAPWYQQVDRLKILRLCEARRFLVDERLGATERLTEPGVIFQRANAAVDVDRCIDLGVARVGDSDFLVARAIGSKHVGYRTQKLCPLSVTQRPQR